jgi:hypothetical protein
MKQWQAVIGIMISYFVTVIIGYIAGREACKPLSPEIIVEKDTLVITIPEPPDTVIQYQVKIARDTLIQKETVLLVDTVYVFEVADVFLSRKTFNWKYVDSEVGAYASTPVDSFYNKLHVKWDLHYKDIIEPQYRGQLGRMHWKGRKEGFFAGMLSILLLSQIF